ncbi:unnamed protein product [Echinostoma caproni]|uniref:Reverse transcriptase RNase H-like domain-containing protein n=1 Tax=Echinostoma caproni TaxID=27848 RepID=A0A3P8JQS8_9TREM|nr:unnamed protein product [Echinostoma caproni]
MEQNGHPVLCISRKLTAAECGYSQTQQEALAVYWAVTRMQKYIYSTHFTIVSEHEALQFIYNPQRSMAKSSAAMVQRWSIALSAYFYDIHHRSAQSIPHADYPAHYATSEEAITGD